MKRFLVYHVNKLVYQSDSLDDAIKNAKLWEYNYSYVDVFDIKYGVKVYSWVY